MTAHAAKGLEFSHVFILRANSGSFPLNYQEALIELPRELYDADSIAQGDDKELCQQEERRVILRGHDPGSGFADHLRQERQPGRRIPALPVSCVTC